MNRVFKEKELPVKMSRFPISIFWFVYAMVLLMSGVHVGLILGLERIHADGLLKVHLVLVYWAIVSVAIILYIRWKIKKAYEQPLYQIMEATKRVSRGDFSVYIEPTNTSDRLDYLDIIILNINKMVEELGSIETLKTDFVSNVSHEMKTPIAVIKNSAQLLRNNSLIESQRMEYVNMIEQAAGRLSGLITNILKLNKLEHQVIVPRLEKYDLSRQLCDCMLQFENQWEEKELEIEVDTEEQVYVEADEELMELVWNNLFSNAVKFTAKQGKITIHQHSDSDWVVVTVTDTGCGMQEETLNRIFERFYQGDTSHGTEGNGLGLALVKRVIDLTKGTIDVNSIYGQGSTFTVRIPICHTSEEEGVIHE